MRGKALIGIGIGGLIAYALIKKAEAALPAPRRALSGVGCAGGNVGYIGCHMGDYASAEVEEAWQRGLYGYAPDLGFSVKGAFKAVTKPFTQAISRERANISRVTKQAKRDVFKTPKRIFTRDTRAILKPLDMAHSMDPLTGKLYRKAMHNDPKGGGDEGGGGGTTDTGTTDTGTDTGTTDTGGGTTGGGGGVVTDPNNRGGDDMTGGTTGVRLDQRQDSEWAQPDYDAGQDDQNWRGGDRGFITDPLLQAGEEMPQPTGEPVFDGDLWWFQNEDGDWAWFDNNSQQWVLEGVTTDMSDSQGRSVAYDAGQAGVGFVMPRTKKPPVAWFRKPTQYRKPGWNWNRPIRPPEVPGGVSDVPAGAGLGLKLFGSTYGKLRDELDYKAKHAAAWMSPSAAIYKYTKEKQPHIFKAYRETEKAVVPYGMIVAGTVISVYSLGAGSPAGIAMIAAGVAQIAAKGTVDYKMHEAHKDMRKLEAESAAEQAQWDKEMEQGRLESAGMSTIASQRTIPVFSSEWWTGEIPQDNALTVGEQV